MTTTAQFAFESKTNVLAALTLFQSSRAGFVDCLIGIKNQKQGYATTLTFDKSAQRLPAFDTV
ncbi:MAG: type II toxin-antitoxin system VapC family toxin [Gammaproteobacteria bacterium]|nr:type II toxin-antitoxin system VapC family toxin [Gammaproteobacteria bacterium]